MKISKLILSASALVMSTGLASAQSITELRIGMVGGESAQDRMNDFSCLQEYAEDALGVPVKMFAPADINGVLQGLLGGTLDVAWIGPSAYASIYLQDQDAVEPVLVKINLDGSYGYHSLGFARVDRNIASLEDMKGKVFGFGDPNSTSGYLIPSIEIPQQIGATMDSGDYFGEVKFTGGHEQTIVAVFNGDIDAGVTWSDAQGDWEDGYNTGALRKAADAGLVEMNDLVQIWKSGVIPESPVVVRKSMPEDAKAAIIELWDNLYETDQECAYNVGAGESLGWDPIDHSLYESVVEARRIKSGG